MPSKILLPAPNQKIFSELEEELAQRIGVENVSALRKALVSDWQGPPTISKV